MFSGVRSFLGRHRRKFIAGGLLIGGFVLATRYSRRKLREWEEREVRELLQRTRRGQHFEATERSCNQMIVQLSACLRNSIVKVVDTERAVDALRKGCEDKVARWNELKSLAVTRSAVVLYSTTMLAVFLRIQLNLVGGLMFKSSQNSDVGDQADEAQRQEYLTLCGYFMSDGVEKLARFIRAKVDEVTASISLMDKLTLRDLEQVYWSIVSSITADAERDPVNNMAAYLIGERATLQDSSTKPLMTKIIRETVDLLESEEVRNLTRTTIRSGFALLIDNISEYFVDSSDNPSTAELNDSANGTKKKSNGYLNLNKTTKEMAKIIPIINGQVRDLPNNDDIASDWLLANLINDKFKILGANVYEAFSF